MKTNGLYFMIPKSIASTAYFGYFAKVVSDIQHLTQQGGADYISGLERFEEESQNIENAFSWIAKGSTSNRNLAKKCCGFVIESRPFLINFIPYKRLEWLDVAYRAAQFIQDDVSQLILMLEMGSTHWFLGNYDYAMQLYAKVIDLFQDEFDKNILATAYGLVGLAKSDIGNYKEAIEYLKKALDIFKDDKQRSIYLPILGKSYAYIDNSVAAISVLKESLFLAHKIKDIRGKADIIGNLGMLYARLGSSTKSLRLFNLALKLARQVHDKRGESNQLIYIASLYSRTGKIFKAEIYIEEALKLCGKTQNLKGILYCNIILCRCAWQKVDLFLTARYAIICYKFAKQLHIIGNLRRLLRYI